MVGGLVVVEALKGLEYAQDVDGLGVYLSSKAFWIRPVWVVAGKSAGIEGGTCMRGRGGRGEVVEREADNRVWVAVIGCCGECVGVD